MNVWLPTLFHDSSPCILGMLKIHLFKKVLFIWSHTLRVLISLISLMKSTFCTDGSLDNSSSWIYILDHKFFQKVSFCSLSFTSRAMGLKYARGPSRVSSLCTLRFTFCCFSFIFWPQTCCPLSFSIEMKCVLRWPEKLELWESWNRNRLWY